MNLHTKALMSFAAGVMLAAGLVKVVGRGHAEKFILAAATVYVVFAVWFGLVALTSPAIKTAQAS